MYQITFINHACYLIETDQSILLVDPWVEGHAFDKGWSLIDKSTSNEQLINYIQKKNKKFHIWYSHEHSDHFSVPFLKLISKTKLKCKVFFQKTLDGRVAQFIRKLDIEVIESNRKIEIIDNEAKIITFPYLDGDSYCLILLNNYSILNINDCVVSKPKEVIQIKNNTLKFTNNIDLLMTQFGYANWIGNINDYDYRLRSAEKKIERIKIQDEIIKPKNILPFASFIYFSHPDNFYMNDFQNTPNKLTNSNLPEETKEKIIILKPWDKLEIPFLKNLNFQNLNYENVKHWTFLFENCKPDNIEDNSYTLDEINSVHIEYKRKLKNYFLFLPYLLEKIKFLPKLKIFINDLNVAYEFSYCKNTLKKLSEKEIPHIALNSSTIMFILKNDFGVNTTYVNAKFSSKSKNGDYIFYRHFSPQEYMKNGWGIKHPIISSKKLLAKLINKTFKGNFIIN
tara:strand:+ start:403 stop:1761 length:1359 start_codon:yes stop_codon:yes gene_type:complete